IGGALNEIFKSFGQNDFGSFSLAGFTTDVFTAVVSLMVYIAMFISLSIFMVILMFIIYAIIRHKLKAAKINRYVSALLGGFFGAVISVVYASSVSMLLSMPFFDYSSQKIGLKRIDVTTTTQDYFLTD